MGHRDEIGIKKSFRSGSSFYGGEVFNFTISGGEVFNFTNFGKVKNFTPLRVKNFSLNR